MNEKLLWLPALCAVLSLTSFIAYAIDKAAARNGDWRIAENTLHFLDLAGGWPGGLLAQKILRHKSAKRSFQTVFRMTVVLHCSFLAWLFSPYGLLKIFST